MIIALAGLSKSGKSFLAKHLGETLNWPVLSFGSYVRHVAATQKLSDDFPTLQTLGQSMVDEDPASFVSAVLDHSDCGVQDNLILDGMRHVEVLDALQESVAPDLVQLVLVKVSQEELASRHENIGLDISEVLAGPAEQQVQSTLAERATLVVDGSGPVENAIDDVLTFVGLK